MSVTDSSYSDFAETEYVIAKREKYLAPPF